MKRSTIILIIYFILNVIIPIIVVKSCVKGTPKEQEDLWCTALKNSDVAVRYLFVPETENDSTTLDIYIRTVEQAGNSGRTLVNGEMYEKDTLLIAANSQGEVNITYEERFALIIENRNPRATFHIDEAVIEELMINSQGTVKMEASNVGVIFVTDSLGIGDVIIQSSNIGTLMSSRMGSQQLFMGNSNVGRVSIPVNTTGYDMENCNVGVMVNGGKRELLIGGSNMNMKIAVDCDTVDVEK